MGFIGHLRWLEKLAPYMAGMHVHDVNPPAYDHLMPPNGSLDFSIFKDLVKPDTVLVFEPAPGTPVEHVQKGQRASERTLEQQLNYLRSIFSATAIERK